SLALLSEILRPETEAERAARPSRSPILLLATVRTDASEPATIALSIPLGLVRRLPLSRMLPDEARDLVGALLQSLGGDRSQGDSAPGDGLDVAALLSEGGGHPLFL